MSAGGGHRSYYRLKLVLFPPDCSDLFSKLKRIFIESSNFPEDFSGNGLLRLADGLEIPTQLVVY
jgi:hypothetical protein